MYLIRISKKKESFHIVKMSIQKSYFFSQEYNEGRA